MPAIVVPCFDEAKRLPIESFEQTLIDHPSLHLCFVDDGSRDETGNMLSEFCRKHPQQSECLSLQSNQGKAEAVRRGLLHLCNRDNEGVGFCDAVGYWDADLAAPLTAVDDLYRELVADNKLDIVIGSRVRLLGRDIRRTATRHYVGRIFATVASLALDLPVYDTQCGAKLFRSGAWLPRILERPFRSRWAFDVELLSRYLIDCQTQGRIPGILEVPLRQWSEVSGSKVRLRSSLAATLTVIRLGYAHRRAIANARNKNDSRRLAR